MNNYIRMANMIPELEDCTVNNGRSGYYGNQYEESSNNYKTLKTEEDIAKETDIVLVCHSTVCN